MFFKQKRFCVFQTEETLFTYVKVYSHGYRAFYVQPAAMKQNRHGQIARHLEIARGSRGPGQIKISPQNKNFPPWSYPDAAAAGAAAAAASAPASAAALVFTTALAVVATVAAAEAGAEAAAAAPAAAASG